MAESVVRSRRGWQTALVGVLLVLVAGLSGCIGGSDADASPEPEDEVDPGDLVETGGVEGRVTDATFSPLRGARVTLLSDANVSAVTDAQGFWRIRGLPAGPVGLQASAVGYAPAVKSAAVVAGQMANVSFRLEEVRLITVEEPRIEPFLWEGFLGCGGPNETQLSFHGCRDPNHEWQMTFETAVNLRGIVFYAEFDSGLVSTGSELQFKVDGSTENNLKNYQWWATGESGLLWDLGEEDLTARNPPYDQPGFDPQVDQITWNLSVFVPRPHVTLQRAVTVWYAAFYVDPPMEGFDPKAFYEESEASS